MKNKISILIVNYNTEEYIQRLLNDLSKQTLDRTEVEVIITNNIQNNKLLEMINRNDFLKKFTIRVIQSNQNIGFGRAMNLAAKNATSEQYLIINPDIEIHQNNFIELLLEKAKDYKNYGIVSTRIISDNKGYKTEYHHYEFEHHLGYHNQVCWISGALMLIKASVFQSIGGFDPDFFMYCEDEDLSYRIKQLNLDLITLIDLEVFHLGGVSEPNKNYNFYLRWYKSRFLFAYKHFSDQDFKSLISQLEKKSKYKILKYRLFKRFYLSSYSEKIAKQQAIQDIICKIQKEGVDWLYFKI